MNPISDHPPFRSPRPARGKVGRLPDTVRQTVNLMLVDGEPYSAIIERLATLGHPGFTPHNISRWKLAGHQRWPMRLGWVAWVTKGSDLRDKLITAATATERRR